MTKDPNYNNKRFVWAAIGIVAAGQDIRASLDPFVIDKATVSLFNIQRRVFLDSDLIPELTKSEIAQEDGLADMDYDLNWREVQRLERERKDLEDGVWGIDFESRSPK